jgi:hypothetical protein
MMNERKFYKPLLICIAVLMLLLSSATQKQLNLDRARLGLTRVAPLENAPPLLAFVTVALGGFRGLIANILWIRATDLQQDEKFFEMVQLSDWITKLQPHFTTVWVHQAWNMAYNISVKFPENRDRWPWLLRGIELLRDEGLKYNPKETLIYRELAWLFQHKMGANLDNAHMLYKQVWAKQMNDLLGQKVNWEELINPQTDDAKARVKVLREKYKMDPEFMKQVDELYGPLEWRLPESHAIYWGALGLDKTRGIEARKKDLITVRRVIYQSLDLASKRGRLVENRIDGTFEFGPNIPVIPKANEAYEQMIVEDKEFYDNIVNAHRNFLKHAVSSYYTHNREADAAKLLVYANQKYPDYFKNVPLDEFVVGYITEETNEGGVDRVKLIIEGFLVRSFYDLAIDEDDKAVSYERMAAKMWNRHSEKVKAADRGRVDLPAYGPLKAELLDRILKLEIPGFSPQLVAQLRTKLRLPADYLAMPTNAVPNVFNVSTNGPAFGTITNGTVSPKAEKKK